MIQTYHIQNKTQKDDGIGGKTEAWNVFKTVRGYLDLQSGNDNTGRNNAVIEESTHVLVIPKHTPGITTDMRVQDPETGRLYSITLPDDPVGIHHHTELYLHYDEAEKAAPAEVGIIDE